MFLKLQVNVQARNYLFNRSHATRTTLLTGVLNKLNILYKKHIYLLLLACSVLSVENGIWQWHITSTKFHLLNYIYSN